MLTPILYALAALGLIASFLADRKRTGQALRRAWKAFENILPQFLSILVVIGVALAVLSPAAIRGLMGKESGVWGVLGAAVLGSVTLIPGFVAFPLAAALLHSGAGYGQITAFVSTLMMVGVITLPLEWKTFGRRAALARNAAALVFSLIAAAVLGMVM